ncbi:MAG TPA: VOC family protein [Edaphocola sp.]|nr:VOC family protein [Edaphocola sp.]
MTFRSKLDTIIAVKDVAASARWYQALFQLSNAHGGGHFAVLTNPSGEVIICLHKWGAHDHPTMMDEHITAGNGLILYFKTGDLESVLKRAVAMGCQQEEPLHLNPNSRRMEFSLRDPDGYFIIVTEYHDYEG